MNNTRNFIYFLSNFPYGWQTVFLEGDSAESHLLNKYDNYMKKANGNSLIGILDFFYNLSPDRQEKMIKWVDENYSN